MPILPNSKHELFAQAIAKGLSASAAYVEAGYPAHGSNAGRLSKKEHIRSRVAELMAAGAEQAEVSVEWVVRGLKAIADRVDAKDVDRISAYEKVGKHLGMFRDKVEHTGLDGGPIQFEALRNLTDDQLAALEPVLAALAVTGASAGASTH